MRRLKHKHTRRAVQFYEINYGFRKPYKVSGTDYSCLCSHIVGLHFCLCYHIVKLELLLSHAAPQGDIGWQFCARPQRNQVRNCSLFLYAQTSRHERSRVTAWCMQHHRMGEPAELLSKLLGAPVKCYVTRCSLLELKGLGAPFSGASTFGLSRNSLCCTLILQYRTLKYEPKGLLVSASRQLYAVCPSLAAAAVQKLLVRPGRQASTCPADTMMPPGQQLTAFWTT